MSGIQAITAVTISGALIFGMALALLGCLKLALARRLQLDDTRIRRLLVALNVAVIPLMLLCGILLDIYGIRPTLLAGSVVLSVALVSLGLRPTYPHAFVSFLLAALGVAALGTATTVLMPRAFFAPAEMSASLNLGYVFIALGALVTPVLAEVLLDTLQLRRTLAVFGLLALTPAILALFPNLEHWQFADQTSDSSALLAEQSSWLTALVFFFYVPLEASVSLWTLALLAERGQDERQASGLLFGFWAAFLGSRLLLALGQHANFLTESWDCWLVVLPPLLAAVVIGNLSGASHRGHPLPGLVLLGLLLGPVLPTLLGMVFRHVAPAEQGLAFGLVFAAGSLGSLLLSPLIGNRLHQPSHITLRVPLFLALLLTAVTLVLGLMTP